MTHLIRSFHIRFPVTEPNESGHSEAIEHPGGKAEVVYERLKTARLRQQHDPGNDTLEKWNEETRCKREKYMCRVYSRLQHCGIKKTQWRMKFGLLGLARQTRRTKFHKGTKLLVCHCDIN